MKKYTEHCDLCNKEFNRNKNGFCIEVGYSKGGWGFRKDFISKTSMEICDDCFGKLEEKAMLLLKTINELKQ